METVYVEVAVEFLGAVQEMLGRRRVGDAEHPLR